MDAIKVMILAGGLGTRLAEETEVRPKPMVEIGGRPILWHILKIYAQYAFRNFYIALGYKGDVIKRYFLDRHSLHGHMTIDFTSGRVQREEEEWEPWTVQLIDTGHETNTGGRIRRLEPWLKHGTFMATYGDGVGDVNLREVLRFHRSHGRVATLTAVRPPARYGALEMAGDAVTRFTEKPSSGEGWINGGFLVFEPEIFSYINGDHDSLEVDVFARLAARRQLMAYRHDRFWQCMDTLRDKRYLESLWQEGQAPWKLWS